MPDKPKLRPIRPEVDTDTVLHLERYLRQAKSGAIQGGFVVLRLKSGVCRTGSFGNFHENMWEGIGMLNHAVHQLNHHLETTDADEEGDDQNED